MCVERQCLVGMDMEHYIDFDCCNNTVFVCIQYYIFYILLMLFYQPNMILLLVLYIYGDVLVIEPSSEQPLSSRIYFSGGCIL